MIKIQIRKIPINEKKKKKKQETSAHNNLK